MQELWITEIVMFTDRYARRYVPQSLVYRVHVVILSYPRMRADFVEQVYIRLFRFNS